MSSLSNLNPGNVAICLRDIVNRLKMGRSGEMVDLVYALFCGILHGGPHFLFHFQMPNNIFEYETPKNIIFGSTHVAPQPP